MHKIMTIFIKETKIYNKIEEPLNVIIVFP